MAEIAIVYWSGTGNTESMAEFIQGGIEEAGANVDVKSVSDSGAGEAVQADILVLGCPSMGDEVLEESEFEPFMESIEDKINGKKLALFGSYDWGDGQWMRDWEERVKNAGAVLVTDCLIVNGTPEGDDEAKCKDFGKAVAAAK